MKEFDFTLKFAFLDSSAEADEYIEKLGEAGCDDAIIGIGQKGRIALHFTREADNAFEAIVSAISDVKGVIPHARLVEATPDLVGLSDIAELLGFTRQNMRKLMITYSQSFPPPVHEGQTSIWHLSNILQWFELKQHRPIDSSIKEVALVTMQVNIAKENASSDSRYQSRLSTLSLLA